MSAKADKLKVGTLHRSFELKRGTFNKDKRTVRVKFSSEASVKRWFGEEVLDHSKESVDLQRMKNGAAVLVEHDPNQRCGITESAEIMADRTGEAEVRFSRTPLGEQCMNEVEDGTLRWLSVGYRVNKFLVDEDTEEYRAISWEPLEVSFVAIPADPSARVMRADKSEENEATLMFKRNIQHEAAATTLGAGGGTAAPVAPAIITHDDFSRQLDEAREIVGLAAHWQRTHPQIAEAAEKAIRDKTPLVKFQREVMEMIKTPAREGLGNGGPSDAASKPNHRGVMSVGRRFVESEGYNAAMVRNNNVARRQIAIKIDDEYSFRGADQNYLTRTTFSATTESINGTSGANISVVPGIAGILNQKPLYIADLFSQGATGSDTIRYLQEDAFTNAATRVAEGAAKPEATLDVSIVNATVEKTAVWLKVTDEMLSDFDQMQSFINGRLGYMVQALEDEQLLTGTGSSQIKGVLNFSGLQTLSGAANPVDALLKAIEYVRGANGSGFAEPDAIVIHPLDWLNVKLTKDANGQYLFGGPGYAPYGTGGFSNVGTAWGLPVVASRSITRGTALVGAFRMAAQIWRRMGLTIDSTNSDNDDFQKNLITIRAEQRMGLTVYQPNKFCTVTGIPS